MTEYLTRLTLIQISTNLPYDEKASILARSRQRSPAGSTFLSHSSADSELLPGVIMLLENHGARVYLDKKDYSLPIVTSRETAKALKERIDMCKNFVLFATDHSRESPWVSWELGIADGLKGPRRTSILPAVEMASDTKWVNQEYFGIYDRIVRGDLEGYEKQVWMVLNQEKWRAMELSEWLRG